MEPFTLRHEKALVEKKLKVSIPPRLRERLWQLVLARNDQWQCGWDEYTTRLAETEKKLKGLLGRTALVAKTQTGQQQGLEAYFREGYPSNVLEVIEQFSDELPGDQRPSFAQAVNASMTAFKCPWLLLDGTFFLIDDSYMKELIESAEGALRSRGFGGATDEMREARENLMANRHKDAIVSALKSVESTLKTILNIKSGVAKDLFFKFREAGFMDDIPQNHAKAISAAVLPGIATLRNELGGHGQGSDVISVPKSYASLAVHLASAITLFLIEQSTTSPQTDGQSAESSPTRDDDVPF
jgi:hypothetical protein